MKGCAGETLMDLNYLFHRQQIERSRAQAATCARARQAHAELAALYEQAIERVTSGRVTFAMTAGRTVH